MKSYTVVKILLERFGVLILSLLAIYFTFTTGFRVDMLKEYQSLLSNTISFVSIFIGVLMTLVGLLLGYANKEVIKRIKVRNANDLLVKYFTYPIIAGIVLVVSSLAIGTIYDEKIINNINILKLISQLWVFIVIYFTGSTIRVMSLMLSILKEVFVEDICIEEKNNINRLSVDECSYDELDF